MGPPRDGDLDASCFDDERHEAFYGFSLTVPEDETSYLTEFDFVDELTE